MRIVFVFCMAFVAAALAGCGDDTGALQLSQPVDAGGAESARQVFPSLSLQGINPVVSMDSVTTVSMGDYYDPQGLRYDLLHVMAIFLWCPHCNNETNNLSQIAGWQADHRVAAVQIAMEGYGSASATWDEIRKWVSDHNLTVPVLVDGQGAQLGQYFKVNAVPVNIVVNPRTMEILTVDVGEVGDVQAYEQKFLSSL
jgi:AhpC/TSA family